MSSVQWVIDGLPEGTQKLLRAYVEHVAKTFGDQLETVSGFRVGAMVVLLSVPEGYG